MSVSSLVWSPMLMVGTCDGVSGHERARCVWGVLSPTASFQGTPSLSTPCTSPLKGHSALHCHHLTTKPLHLGLWETHQGVHCSVTAHAAFAFCVYLSVERHLGCLLCTPVS